jgi:hypothetical protein
MPQASHRLGGDVGEFGRQQGVVELAAQEVLGGQVADHLGGLAVRRRRAVSSQRAMR